MKKGLALILVSMLPVALGARPLPPAAGAFVIRASRVWTSGPAGIIPNAALLIDGGKIARIIRDGRLPDAPLTDYPGLTMMPCEIDAHTYLSAYRSLIAHSATMTPDLRAYAVFDPRSPEVLEARRSGIGTVHLAPDNGCVIGGLSSIVKLSPDPAEPSILRPEAFLKVSLSSAVLDPDHAPTSLMGAEFMLDEAMRSAVRGPGTRDGIIGRTSLKALADGRIRPIIAASSSPEIRTALAWLERWRLEGIILGGEEAGAFAGELKRKDIPVLLSAIRFDSPDEAAANARRLLDEGVRMAFVSNMPEGRPIDLRHSALALHRNGLAGEEALKTITAFPAQILGIGGSVGSLEEGKDADFVILSGDPLDLSSRIVAVYVGGRLVTAPEGSR